jgi:hypothetical protein
MFAVATRLRLWLVRARAWWMRRHRDQARWQSAGRVAWVIRVAHKRRNSVTVSGTRPGSVALLLSVAVIAVRIAAASMIRVVWRCQESHCRSWC